MGIVLNARYELANEGELSPELVIAMLRDVQKGLGDLDPSFNDSDLEEVLQVVEKGEFQIGGNLLPVKIDFSKAAEFISEYRKRSEGGCTICSHRQVNGALEDFRGYCEVFDDSKGPLNGNTPLIAKHLFNPCKEFDPPLPSLDKLLNK
ncbi:hypothetical protein HN832_01865 [archaeon]|jgi:hypothetical protein|nr:hypothetical protein [archaeon]MBT4373099.1 hypothetical protein [archaeon]MBT4531444.1 hypothetical protein [archaeon]MBT7001378.1 hypothetical protein [archaeon]MBT7282136.1 hypothetical protein [archaeon]